ASQRSGQRTAKNSTENGRGNKKEAKVDTVPSSRKASRLLSRSLDEEKTALNKAARKPIATTSPAKRREMGLLSGRRVLGYPIRTPPGRQRCSAGNALATNQSLHEN